MNKIIIAWLILISFSVLYLAACIGRISILTEQNSKLGSETVGEFIRIDSVNYETLKIIIENQKWITQRILHDE